MKEEHSDEASHGHHADEIVCESFDRGRVAQPEMFLVLMPLFVTFGVLLFTLFYLKPLNSQINQPLEQQQEVPVEVENEEVKPIPTSSKRIGKKKEASIQRKQALKSYRESLIASQNDRLLREELDREEWEKSRSSQIKIEKRMDKEHLKQKQVQEAAAAEQARLVQEYRILVASVTDDILEYVSKNRKVDLLELSNMYKVQVVDLRRIIEYQGIIIDNCFYRVGQEEIMAVEAFIDSKGRVEISLVQDLLMKHFQTY